jgi:hypothetical protein
MVQLSQQEIFTFEEKSFNAASLVWRSIQTLRMDQIRHLCGTAGKSQSQEKTNAIKQDNMSLLNSPPSTYDLIQKHMK